MKIGSDNPLHFSANTSGSLSFVDRALGSIASTIDAAVAQDEHELDSEISPRDDERAVANDTELHQTGGQARVIGQESDPSESIESLEISHDASMAA